jgi:glycine amidinotransferase
MIEATMPPEYCDQFKPGTPFPPEIILKAQEELDNLARILEREGIRVYRPKHVDWLRIGGYTGAMPRDGLMTVGNTLIEAPFAWGCRRNEIKMGYSDILDELSATGSSRICRAPQIIGENTIYDQRSLNGFHDGNSGSHFNKSHWAINNSRPAFDAADFMRFGKTIIGQLSHVTNQEGVDYLRAIVPEGYSVEILQTTDDHAMHIDATILPLRNGLLVYNPNELVKKSYANTTSSKIMSSMPTRTRHNHECRRVHLCTCVPRGWFLTPLVWTKIGL